MAWVPKVTNLAHTFPALLQTLVASGNTLRITFGHHLLTALFAPLGSLSLLFLCASGFCTKLISILFLSEGTLAFDDEGAALASLPGTTFLRKAWNEKSIAIFEGLSNTLDI